MTHHDLGSLPDQPEDVAQWEDWASERRKSCEVSCLSWDDDHPHGITACWALLCSGPVGRSIRLDPANLGQLALNFYGVAHDLTAIDLRAAERLAHLLMLRGETSREALGILAAFACRMESLSPVISRNSREVFLLAPWQVEHRAIIDLVSLDSVVPGEPLAKLIDARYQGEAENWSTATRELLEAVVAAYCLGKRGQSLDDVAPDTTFKIDTKNGRRASTALANLILADLGEKSVAARLVVAHAVDGDHSPSFREQAKAELSSRAWSLTEKEWYDWAAEKPTPAAVRRRLDQYVDQGVGRQALRAAEALLVVEVDAARRPGQWWGDRHDLAVSRSIKALRDRGHHTPGPILRRAIATAAKLYARLRIRTESAWLLLDWVLNTATMSQDRGAPLADERDILLAYHRVLDPASRAASVEELWSQTSSHPRTDRERQLDARVEELLKPLMNGAAVWDPEDVAASSTVIAGVQLTFEQTFNWMATAAAGELDQLLSTGHNMRASGTLGELYDHAEQLVRSHAMAAAGVGGLTALAGGFAPIVASPLVLTADVGVTLGISLRALAGIAALYGYDARTPEGARFVLNALLAGMPEGRDEAVAAFANEVTLSGGGGAAIETIGKKLAAREALEEVLEAFTPRIAAALGPKAIAAVVPVFQAGAQSWLSYQLVRDSTRAALLLGYWSARADRERGE